MCFSALNALWNLLSTYNAYLASVQVSLVPPAHLNQQPDSHLCTVHKQATNPPASYTHTHTHTRWCLSFVLQISRLPLDSGPSEGKGRVETEMIPYVARAAISRLSVRERWSVDAAASLRSESQYTNHLTCSTAVQCLYDAYQIIWHSFLEVLAMSPKRPPLLRVQITTVSFVWSSLTFTFCHQPG
jgi:hypothetical protein